MRDRRVKPRIPVKRVVRGLLFMLCARVGSLNGIEQALGKCPRRTRWHGWMGGPLPSADRLGEVAAVVEAQDVRAALYEHYRLRRRKKTLAALPGGLRVLLLDGHEHFSSYLKQCKDCQERKVEVAGKQRLQYYHRYVLAYLLYEGGRLLLDVEMQRQGEGEIAAATRLLKRLLGTYPRAFNVVGGDALYLDPTLCKLILQHHKNFIAVLKNENRELIKDLRGLLDRVEPLEFEYEDKHCVCHDIEGFNTWTQLGHEVRVVRSVETRTVRRQRTKEHETTTTEWLWATSLSRQEAPTNVIVLIGHGRWDIENLALNELANEWHADHLYYHDINAILVIMLLLLLVYNLFHVWIARGLKPALRDRYSIRFFARLIASEFYQELGVSPSRSPPL